MDKQTDFASGKAAKLRARTEQLRQKGGLNDREEFAADAVGLPISLSSRAAAPMEHAADAKRLEETEEAVNRSRTFGYIALFTALISLFALPAVLGPAGVALGFFAFLRGNRALGAWAISLGLLAIAAYFFLVPNYA
ncbi:hypothetical protein B5M42_022365 [Paenibacillus athensensis]|uniref:DUF4190 domain-containing protein n=1 Tax=Paenibacillus athensensis TaxID=1967502 RepID=A0A4Y8PST8_9BACL|nr:hypothetical protein [Paenibacillus athensensis]MCD1261551.1 hypothetical protein [Paenibacillus athensensis]